MDRSTTTHEDTPRYEMAVIKLNIYMGDKSFAFKEYIDNKDFCKDPDSALKAFVGRSTETIKKATSGALDAT